MDKTVQVSVKMVATSEGYYLGRIIRIGEEFLYEGGLNNRGNLPMWADPLDADWDKKAKVKAKVKAAPVAKTASPLPALPSLNLGLKSV